MFVNRFYLIVSKHSGVQRATLCRNVSTILSKSEKGILPKNPNIKKTNTNSRILYSSFPNDPNQRKNEAQAATPRNQTDTLSRAQKLKKAVAEYGTTVIVFHVSISLISLGSCYLLVSSGLDVNEALVKFGLHEWAKENIILVSNAGTFAVAYAIHKVFAPVRISITLASVPFIVKYLRQKGILKK